MEKLSSTSLGIVASPEITINLGGYTISTDDKTSGIFINSAIINKQISDGATDLNTYEFDIVYAPIMVSNVALKDPNFFEYLLGIAENIMYLSYGDANPYSEMGIYSNVEVFMSGYTMQYDSSSNSFRYTISGVSSVYTSKLSTKNFDTIPAGTKLSTAIKKIYDEDLKYTIFNGNEIQIDTDDRAIDSDYEEELEMNSFTYIKSLVSHMFYQENDQVDYVEYVLYTIDDIGDKKLVVERTIAESEIMVSDKYIDVGTSDSTITSLSMSVDSGIGLLYKYYLEDNEDTLSYDIDASGGLVYSAATSTTNNEIINDYNTTYKENFLAWMQGRAITATITVHGLVNDINLMDIIELGVYYADSQHSSSGQYYITSIMETVSGSSFNTQIGLTKPSSYDEEALG